ncbi:MAG: hypothetical protein QM765_09290 [Myxococcales bacterium]
MTGLLLALLVTATAAGAVLGGLSGAVAPVAVAGGAWALGKAPLRWTAAALLAAVLTLEVSSDTDGHWHTPLVALGDLLAENLDASLHVPGAKLSGLEVVLLALLAVGAWRRGEAARVDGRWAGQVGWTKWTGWTRWTGWRASAERTPERAMEARTARVVPDAVLLFLGCVAYAVVRGLARGGSVDIAILHVRPLVRVGLFYGVFNFAFAGRADHRLLGRVVVFAALVRAALAVWIALFVRPVVAPEMIYATNHGDSVLFSVACVLLLADLAEHADRRRLLQALLLLPPLFAGMVANNRRLAWVMLAFGVFAAFAAVPSRRAWKRGLALAGALAAPLLAVYVAAGWGSTSQAFAPVRVLQSLWDGTTDSSTLYREIENWNLAMSMREDPLLGRGFGHTYTEYSRGADISSIFALYAAVPHNGVLGLLLFAGLFAFVGIWTAWVVGLYLAVRVARFARDPRDRVAALGCLGALLSSCVLVYGDLGFAFVQTQIALALALALVGKLAVATGAWSVALPVRGLPSRSAPA